MRCCVINTQIKANMLSNREIFEKVKNHLLTQNARSESDDGLSCLYRGPNGLKCAVGCLIKDEYFSEYFFKNFNTAKVSDKDVLHVLELSGVSVDNLELLRGLQGIHDYSPVVDWKEKLERIRLRYNL